MTPTDLRLYLATYLDQAASTYANRIQSVKVFFQDFLNRVDLTLSRVFDYLNQSLNQRSYHV